MGSCNTCISFWGMLAVIFLGPMGQLYQRVFALGGSLSNWWLLIPIFWLPPFSILPALMMWWGFVDKCKTAQGAPCPMGQVYDWWMIGPMIMKIFAGFVASYIFPNGGLIGFFLPFILQLFVTMIPLYLRNVEQVNRTTGITINTFADVFKYIDFRQLTFAFTNAVIQNGVADLCTVGVDFIPIVGEIIMIIEFIPLIGSVLREILWSVFYGTTYIIMNMITEQWRSDLPTIPFFGQWSDIIASVIFFILSCVMGAASAVTSFIPI